MVGVHPHHRMQLPHPATPHHHRGLRLVFEFIGLLQPDIIYIRGRLELSLCSNSDTSRYFGIFRNALGPEPNENSEEHIKAN
jgi:hypothetical protein